MAFFYALAEEVRLEDCEEILNVPVLAVVLAVQWFHRLLFLLSHGQKTASPPSPRRMAHGGTAR